MLARLTLAKGNLDSAKKLMALPKIMLSRINRMGGKSKNRRQYKDDYYSDEEDVFPSSYSYTSSPVFNTKFDNVPIRARNPIQEKYIKYLEDPQRSVIISSGPAGVAKTYLCNAIGIKKLLSGEVERLIITRPAVSVDEEHGFLPGTLEDKMDPWMRPIYDVFYKFISPQQVKQMILKQQIEICPLAYMRGRTFDRAWICADEMQNSTVQQMLMLLTRVGMESKLVITGDPYQHDRGYQNNGFSDFITKFKLASVDMELSSDVESDFGLIEFTENHVERSKSVKTILNIYKKY